MLKKVVLKLISNKDLRMSRSVFFVSLPVKTRKQQNTMDKCCAIQHITQDLNVHVCVYSALFHCNSTTHISRDLLERIQLISSQIKWASVTDVTSLYSCLL
jgi:hypothetical protein